MTIEWDSLVIETVIFAVMVYGALCVENWAEKRKRQKEEDKGRRQIIQFVTNDLQNKLRFIKESIKYQDFKPFFTDMWGAVILGGKQMLLPFQLFENLQHTHLFLDEVL